GRRGRLHPLRARVDARSDPPGLRAHRTREGVGRTAVLRRHAFKNAAIPLVTLVGLDLPRFLSGSVVVESIFAWPGMGRLFWEEAQRTDIPVVMAVLMF